MSRRVNIVNKHNPSLTDRRTGSPVSSETCNKGQLYNLKPIFPETTLDSTLSNHQFSSEWLNEPTAKTNVPNKVKPLLNTSSIEFAKHGKRKQFEASLPQTIAKRNRDTNFTLLNTPFKISMDNGYLDIGICSDQKGVSSDMNASKELMAPIYKFLEENFTSLKLNATKKLCFHFLFMMEADDSWWLSGEIYKDGKPISADLHLIAWMKPYKRYEGYYELIEYEEMFTTNNAVTIMCTKMNKLDYPPVLFTFSK